MNPPCASCSKPVYPTEKINCLDKIWHKGCFRCTACGMTLNLKNYRGYDKKPYCPAHYPTNKPIQVADTPEMLRVSKNSENVSQVKYHKEYEASKAQYTQVVDDPESQRVARNTKVQSDVAYKGTSRQEPATELNAGRYEAQPETHRPGPVRQDFHATQAYQAPVQQDYRGAHAYQAPVQQETHVGYPSQVPVSVPTSTRPPDGTQAQRYVAIYEYTAGDDDEISLLEGDVIILNSVAGEGWMIGTNQRTGQSGMLPSNYVELVMD